jgi:hypothetical protein
LQAVAAAVDGAAVAAAPADLELHQGLQFPLTPPLQ